MFHPITKTLEAPSFSVFRVSEQSGASANLQLTTGALEVLACVAFRQRFLDNNGLLANGARADGASRGALNEVSPMVCVRSSSPPDWDCPRNLTLSI
jgi:hypothetical protein